MQIQGSHTFAAPRQVVWDALLDPTVLSMALPGGEQLAKISDNEYKAVMNVKVGPVQGKFDGKVELSNINEPQSYTMKVGGQGAPGFLNGAGDVSLSEVAGGTLMSYVGDAQVGGRIAGVGQRLIESTAKSIIKQGLLALDGQIQARVGVQPAAAIAVATEVVVAPVATAPAVESPTIGNPLTSPIATPQEAPATPATPKPIATPAPSISTTQIALEVAKDVSRDLLSDVIPLKNQEKTLWFGLGALAMFVLVVIIRSVS